MPCRPSTSISSTRLPLVASASASAAGDRGLAGAALAGDHVQPHAVPVCVPHAHEHEAIRAGADAVPWPGRHRGVSTALCPVTSLNTDDSGQVL